MITFSGPAGVQTYRAIALKHGLKMYDRCGLRPNRAWTPTAMLKAATSITGKAYGRGRYADAIADLEVWIQANGINGEDS